MWLLEQHQGTLKEQNQPNQTHLLHGAFRRRIALMSSP